MSPYKRFSSNQLYTNELSALFSQQYFLIVLAKIIWRLWGMNTFSRAVNLPNCFGSSWKGIYFERKEFTPDGEQILSF